MQPFIAERRSEIAQLCRRFHVRRLEVFGSAAGGGDFDPAASDVDFLVEYEPARPAPSLGEFFALRDELRGTLGRPVDLVMEGGCATPTSAPPSWTRRKPSMGGDARAFLSVPA